MKNRFFLILLLVCAGCSNNSNLKQALNLAGENRAELEKVLKHYKKDPEKLKAARFLIENMPGHLGQDVSVLERMQPVYDKYAVISEKHEWKRTDEWREEINDMWDEEKDNFRANPKQDITTVKADWLINDIDRSFKAWKENVYTQHISFEDFCENILPYRFFEGIVMDDCRDVFYERHAQFFNDPDKHFIEAADSLLEIYSSLTHSDWAAASMPMYSTVTFEQIKRGLCDDRTWFNSLLMSSLGMAAAIDFVPEWGNRNGGHSWNSLIVDGETYPFEPFWDEDRWKYKRIYNNEHIDMVWAKFRLPKVYRHTYKYNIDGPIGDENVNRNDIPRLFRNPFIKDVSSQYFKTADVELTITEDIPEDARYCYLCVFNDKGWKPVQWGKIGRNKTAVFKEMGKDIVYLPMYCKNGTMVPAAPMFYLSQDGVREEFKCEDEKISITVRNHKSCIMDYDIADSKKLLVGACLLGYRDLDSKADTLYVVPDDMYVWGNDVALPNAGEYRYIRVVPAQDTAGLCEIAFFENGSGSSPVSGVKVSADIVPLIDGEELGFITDNLSATGFAGVFKTEKNRNKGFLFDLGRDCKIDAFSYLPYTYSKLYEDPEQELCYWDGKRWVPVESFGCESTFYTVDNVPKGTVYRLKHPYIGDCMFSYKDGMVNWL